MIGPESNPKFCPACGTDWKQGAAFCVRCGGRFRISPWAPEQKPSPTPLIRAGKNPAAVPATAGLDDRQKEILVQFDLEFQKVKSRYNDGEDLAKRKKRIAIVAGIILTVLSWLLYGSKMWSSIRQVYDSTMY